MSDATTGGILLVGIGVIALVLALPLWGRLAPLYRARLRFSEESLPLIRFVYFAFAALAFGFAVWAFFGAPV